MNMGNIDGNCVVLLVLVIFCIYIDYNNKNSLVEGLDYSELDSGNVHSPHKGGDDSDIGFQPKKLEMDVSGTPSIQNELKVLQDNPVKLSNEVMKQDVGLYQSGSQLEELYPRFGGYGNMGGPGKMVGEGSQDSGGLDSFYSSQSLGDSSGHDMGTGDASNDVELAMVYADWCGWSQKALPDFQKVASEFNGKNNNNTRITVRAYNVEDKGPEGQAAKDLAEKYDVQGFPDIFFLKDNQKIEAESRDYAGLVAQLQSMIN